MQQLALRDHQSAETMNELRALNARFIHNFVTNDVPSHDAILHPRFINIWPTGQRWDRATYLKYWATAFDPEVIVYWDVRDELITVIGDVALVRSTNKCTRRRDGNEVTGMTTYTDTYLFENGAWKCIQAQITAVAPEHYPADDTIVSVYIKGKLSSARRERLRGARRLTAREGLRWRRALQRCGDGRRQDAPLTSGFPTERITCSSSITPPAPARWLRISLWKRPAPPTRPSGSTSRTTSRPAREYLEDQSEGAGAGAGDRPRHLDRNAGDPRLHRAELSESEAGAAMIPSHSRRRSPSTAISAPRCMSRMPTRCAAIAGRPMNPRSPT